MEDDHYSQASMHSEGSQCTHTRAPSIPEQIAEAEADLAAIQSHLQTLRRMEEYEKRLALHDEEMRKIDQTLAEEEGNMEMYNIHKNIIDSRAKVQQAVVDNSHPIASPTPFVQDPYFQNLPSAITSRYPSNTDSSRCNPAPAAPLNPQTQDTHDYQRDSYLATAIAKVMDRNRLPVPTPKPFTGNPIEYTSFKRSFKTLVENKAITAEERIYYLEQYLQGEAKEAVAGCFYGTEDLDYQRAWQTLEKRFGHPFRIQEAFREKLNNWPKLSDKDNAGLQRYTDFLRACHDAMPHIKGLRVLSDCKENQRLASKLPDHIIQGWSRAATNHIDDFGEFPDFSYFVAFVERETRIACNPIASFAAIKGQLPLQLNTVKARTLASFTGPIIENKQGMNNHKKECPYCKGSHYLPNCKSFESKSQGDKTAFIQKSGRCFGCLRKGHISKDCTMRHKCNICHRMHPTVLHQTRETDPRETSSDKPTSENSVHCHWIKVKEIPVIAPKETPNLPKSSLANTNQTDNITSQDDIIDMTQTYPTEVKPKLKVEDQEIEGKLQREMKISPKIVRDHTIAGKTREVIQSTSKMEGDTKINEELRRKIHFLLKVMEDSKTKRKLIRKVKVQRRKQRACRQTTTETSLERTRNHGLGKTSDKSIGNHSCATSL